METKKVQISRRNLLRGAAVGAAGLAGAAVLAACTPAATADDTAAADSTATTTTPATNTAADSTTIPATMVDPKSSIDYTKATNFNVMPESATTVGTTAENLMSAITGETGATTKYEAFSQAAATAGYDQIARLFQATADAEKIHIELEYAQLVQIDSAAEKPAPPTVEAADTDINLIMGANGEIYETSDMYPSFIKAAVEAGDDAVAAVFARAKLAESVHAERYMDAYNNIDTPDDEKYYLCPECGYIHKGENIVACPICMTGKAAFTAY